MECKKKKKGKKNIKGGQEEHLKITCLRGC